MSSTITNDQQNIEDQYFDKFGLPMIFCDSHKNKVCEFINICNLTDNYLVCGKCIIKNNLVHNCLICIDEVLKKNPSEIIQNWPPFENPSLYQHLMTKEVQESIKIQSIEQTNKYFDKLKVDILKTIEDHQKKILVHINTIEENRQRVIDVYNEISSKDEFKNEFLKNKNNLQQLQQYLKQIISTKQLSSKQNSSKIINVFDEFIKSQKQFQFQYIENIFKQLLIDLKSIDVLNPLLTIEQQLSSRNSDEKNNQEEQNKQILQVDKIMNLINNKSNFCNPKFLEKMKDILMMNKQIFSQIDLNNAFIGENQPIQFEYLSQYQLQQLSYVVKCLKNYNFNNQSNIQIQEQMWKNQLFEQNLMINQQLFKENNEKKIGEIIKKRNILQNNIFFSKTDLFENDRSGVDLLQSLKIIKSNYGQPDLISLKKIDNYYIIIEKNSLKDWSQVVFDEVLIPEKKYYITIETDLRQMEKSTEIHMGLLPTSLKDKAGNESKLSFYLNQPGQGIDKIEFGKPISQIINIFSKPTLCFQICLKEKILRCLTVVSGCEKNISCLNDWNKVQENEKYNFYIALGGQQKIEIQQFKMIEQFNKW